MSAFTSKSSFPLRSCIPRRRISYTFASSVSNRWRNSRITRQSRVIFTDRFILYYIKLIKIELNGTMTTRRRRTSWSVALIIYTFCWNMMKPSKFLHHCLVLFVVDLYFDFIKLARCGEGSILIIYKKQSIYYFCCDIKPVK